MYKPNNSPFHCLFPILLVFFFVFLCVCVTTAPEHMPQTKQTRTTPPRVPPARATTDKHSRTQKKCQKLSASSRFPLLYFLSHPISGSILTVPCCCPYASVSRYSRPSKQRGDTFSPSMEAPVKSHHHHRPPQEEHTCRSTCGAVFGIHQMFL